MRRTTQWVWLETKTNRTNEDESLLGWSLRSKGKVWNVVYYGMYLEDLPLPPAVLQAQERKLKLEQKRKKLAAAAALLEERNADGSVSHLETPVFSLPSRTLSTVSAAVTSCHKLIITIDFPSEPSGLLRVVPLTHSLLTELTVIIWPFCCSTIINIEPKPF